MPTISASGSVFEASTISPSAATHGVEQRALVEQVVAGIGRQPEFGEGHQRGALVGSLARQLDGPGGIEGRIGHAAARAGHRHAREVVRVEIEELLIHRAHQVFVRKSS
jgi:hypothetical protein